MINFIIFEDNKLYQEQYKSIILKIIAPQKEKYHIHIFNEYNDQMQDLIVNGNGKKIYLLDIEVPGKNGLKVAKEIRKTGDWQSQIIIVTSYESFKEQGFTSKLLMLDFISKKENIESKILSAIKTALEIQSLNKSYNFTYNNEFYQIPYDDILYFEKCVNNNYTSLITKDNTYKIKKSIKNIEEELSNIFDFFKTHQSCIVNTRNIVRIDYNQNIIYFRNKKTNLLARNKKKDLKEFMEKEAYDELY